MADPPAPSESPAQAKARLRRERLAAKSGAARLQQITALQGGPPRDMGEFAKALPARPTSLAEQHTPSASGTATPDPDEVDMSSLHTFPAPQPRLPSPFAFDGTPPSPYASQQATTPSQEHIMAMLQQVMGGTTAAPGGRQAGTGPEHFPPGLANLFSAMHGNAAAEPSPEKSSAWVWRLVHAIFSLGLAIYFVSQSPFTGSQIPRRTVVDANSAMRNQNFAHCFYLFATFEIVLQTSRYLVEKGQLQGSGVLSTIAAIVPAPYAGYVNTIGRYSVIYSTVVGDAMVIVFVLGATTWWRGAVEI